MDYTVCRFFLGGGRTEESSSILSVWMQSRVALLKILFYSSSPSYHPRRFSKSTSNLSNIFLLVSVSSRFFYLKFLQPIHNLNSLQTLFIASPTHSSRLSPHIGPRLSLSHYHFQPSLSTSLTSRSLLCYTIFPAVSA